MPKTSACCPRAPDRMRGGFTLLEMLLVLVLLAMATALVAPNLSGRLQGSEDLAQIEAVEDLLASLPARSRQDRRPATWTAERMHAVLVEELHALPKSVHLLLPHALKYDARGLAQGGEVRLMRGERLLAAWTVEPHLGRPLRREGGLSDAR